MVSVFIDASSKIQNFPPALEDDPSARLRMGMNLAEFQQLRLFHPFILYGTFDLHLTKVDWVSLKQNPSLYLKAGRPLVAQESCEGQSTFLKRKLLGGNDMLSESGSLCCAESLLLSLQGIK